MSIRRAVGIGGTSQATADDVLALVRETLGSLPIGPETLLATLDRRSSIAYAVGAALQMEVILFTREQLAAVEGIVASSPAALAALRLPSVAEAAALAAVGEGGRLVMLRRTGRRCTCAVAEGPEK